MLMRPDKAKTAVYGCNIARVICFCACVWWWSPHGAGVACVQLNLKPDIAWKNVTIWVQQINILILLIMITIIMRITAMATMMTIAMNFVSQLSYLAVRINDCWDLDIWVVCLSVIVYVRLINTVFLSAWTSMKDRQHNPMRLVL